MANEPVRDFLLDDSGDLAVVNGDLGFARGQVAVKQGIAVRVKSFLGEIMCLARNSPPSKTQIAPTVTYLRTVFE